MNTETLFWIFAISGTALFSLRFALTFLGVGLDAHHGDVYYDVDNPIGTEASFRLLSIEAIGSFIMMFGWSGLSALSQFELGVPLSVATASICGFGAMYITARLTKMLIGLQDEGAVFSLENAIGKNANVYERIPASGMGRIQMNIGGMMREIQAVSEEKTDLDSHKLVKVVRVVDNNTVSVSVLN